MSHKIKQNLLSVIGLAGTLIYLAIFIWRPSFPTPDKLLILLIFVSMIFRQTIAMLKHILPFVSLILVYESFRSVVPTLNNHVNYTLAPGFDKLVFGRLPTATLQSWLWHGHTRWYDVALYIPYLLFFAVPLGLAVLVWKTREKYYWRIMATYVVTFFSAFLTFLIFPAAPPWMASQSNLIEPLARISSSVWASLGLHNFPSIYNHLSPNPVAAVPSLHSAISTLTSIVIFKLYGRRWGLLSLIYPISIYFGVVYEGEHYVFDVIAGIAYAFGAYYLTPYLIPYVKRWWRSAKAKSTNNTKSASESAR